MSRILYVCSEAFPLVKTGGLADVAGSLPSALLKKQQDVKLILPAYPDVLAKTHKTTLRASTVYYNLPVNILETRLPGTHVPVFLVDCPAAYQRPGGPYSDNHGQAWHDNALRFAILCHAAVDLALNRFQLNWQPDVVHCNDWQTGLVPAILSLHEQRPATVFTVHNIAYQGLFDYQTFVDLQLPTELWHMDGLEFYGQLSFIKGGLAYADKITTVSPTYAKEILEPEYSYGLDGLLRHRAQDLVGIINGIDVKHWNPGTDAHLKQTYNWRKLDNKVVNKTALQQELGLAIDDSVVMLGMVSRLVEQKGLDLILGALDSLLSSTLQVVILGTGETHYEMLLSNWAKRQPDKMKFIIGYDEALAHRIEAASDLYLMPSVFEPCGLNQIYSLRYGTLPIVTAVGGLIDTVTDATASNINNGTATGFVLKTKTSASLIKSVEHALTLFENKPTWRKLQQTAMQLDFSWQASAGNYVELYQQVLEQA